MTAILDGWLTCLVCGQHLTQASGAMICPDGHSYDIAKQGYVNLLGHAPPKNADTAAMLDARARFLGHGLYDQVADAIVDAVRGRTRIVDVGAGTGYYLAHVLDELPEAHGLATDVSVAAAKRAARAHPRAGAIVADTWAGLPIRDGAADAVMCVFAPRNAQEFARILQPGGTLVVAVPTPLHLEELRERHHLLDVAADKVEGVIGAFPGWPSSVWTEEYQIGLDQEQASDLIAMGPNAFHHSPDDVAPGPCTVSVTVLRFTRPLG